MIQFDAPLVLWLAPVVMVLGSLGSLRARHARLQRAAAWSRQLGREARQHGRWGPLALGATLGLGTLGFSGPRWGREQVVTETQALNLVLAIDVSRSMLARDMTASRLDRALREARRIVQDLRGDRIGLVAFAGSSYILSPLTVDASALRLFLDALAPDFVSRGGTALGAVLRQGHEMLSATSDLADRVLVVFTDGETHDSLPAVLDEARRIAAEGTKLVLVAEGGTRPVRIPVGADSMAEYLRDDQGRIVETARRDDVLIAVADAGEGTIVAAELADQAGAVRDLVASFKRAGSAQTETRRGVSRAWIPIALAALVLLATSFARRTGSLILWAALLAAPAQAQVLGRDPAQRAWAAGDVERAAALFRAQAESGESGDTAWLNAGTASLFADDWDFADQALMRAARSLDPEIRFRALFNRGWMGLQRAALDSASASEHLAQAVQAYREALRLRPGSDDAKWNLELATRREKESARSPSPQGGGGAQGQDERPGESSRQPSGLDRAQAEQILASIGQEELNTRARRLRRIRESEPPGGKDW